LCESLAQPQWLDDPEFADERLRVRNRGRLNDALTAVFVTKPTAHWIELLNAVGVPAGPVYSVPQVFQDAQVRHLGVVQSVAMADGVTVKVIGQPVVLTRTPAHVDMPAPDWGEHTDEVLRELGYPDETIARLHDEGVV
jgi:crotonobetainyl-CoA:carnitine CoA-transferase CaiB-like acyl-CoA transferase